MPSKERTSFDILDNAYSIATESGLKHVYVGNISHGKGSNTYCPNCKSLVIGRRGYSFTKFNVNNEKKCMNCGFDLSKDIVGQINKKPSKTRFF